MYIKPILDDFPKTENLKDASIMKIKLMTKEDKQKMLDFYAQIPAEDKIYVRMDVTSEGLDHWIRCIEEETAVTLLGFVKEELVGIVSLHQDVAASCRHVGYIRLSVSRKHRAKGIASILAHEIYRIAFTLNLEKVCTEITPEQEMAQTIFTIKLGFKKEAVLKDHIKDSKGYKHDMIILSNSPAELLEELKRRTIFTETIYSQEY